MWLLPMKIHIGAVPSGGTPPSAWPTAGLRVGSRISGLTYSLAFELGMLKWT